MCQREGGGEKIPDNSKSQRSHKLILCNFDKGFYIDVEEGDCTISFKPRDKAWCVLTLPGDVPSLTSHRCPLTPHCLLAEGCSP